MAAPPGSRPPGAANHAQNRTDRASGGNETAVGAALVTRYVHLAMSDPACAELSVHRINKAVRRFIASGLHQREFLHYVVGYADPTGEAAVANVMRQRRAS